MGKYALIITILFILIHAHFILILVNEYDCNNIITAAYNATYCNGPLVFTTADGILYDHTNNQNNKNDGNYKRYFILFEKANANIYIL